MKSIALHSSTAASATKPTLPKNEDNTARHITTRTSIGAELENLATQKQQPSIQTELNLFFANLRGWIFSHPGMATLAVIAAFLILYFIYSLAAGAVAGEAN